MSAEPVSDTYKLDLGDIQEWVDQGCPEGVSGRVQDVQFLIDMTRHRIQATEQAQAEIDRLRGEVDQVLANAIDRCSKSPEGLRNAVLALGIGEARALLATMTQEDQADGIESARAALRALAQEPRS